MASQAIWCCQPIAIFCIILAGLVINANFSQTSEQNQVLPYSFTCWILFYLEICYINQAKWGFHIDFKTFGFLAQFWPSCGSSFWRCSGRTDFKHTCTPAQALPWCSCLLDDLVLLDCQTEKDQMILDTICKIWYLGTHLKLNEQTVLQETLRKTLVIFLEISEHLKKEEMVIPINSCHLSCFVLNWHSS